MTDEEQTAPVAEPEPAPVPQYAQNFRDNGYAFLPWRLGAQQIEQLLQSLLSAFGGYDTGVRNNCWHYSAAVRQLALTPAFQEAGQAIYGAELVPFSCDSYVRPAQLPYRMDALWLESYEPHGRTCGIWTALHDMTPDNGPLVVFPGTHYMHLPTLQSLGGGIGAEYLPLHYRHMRDAVQFRRPVYLYPRRGQSIIIHGHLIYGNAAARNPKADMALHHTLYAAPGGKFHWQPWQCDIANNVWTRTDFPQLR